ncbi:hypothetical protein Tco_0871565 [Tanacetum coccineum]
MSFSKRSDNAATCYTKPLDSLKNWNDHFFWVDDFACPVSFPWHTAKNVTRDPTPVAADFNAQDYATLVAHPSPFRKFPEAFLHRYLCFHTYPGSHQGESTSGREGANIQPVVEAVDTVVEDVVPVQPKRQRKMKTVVVDAGGPSHPPKRLREDHGTPSGAFVGGKSKSAVQRLLVGAVLNAEVRGEVIPTLPFVTSSVSAMPELEGEDHTDSAEVDSLVRSSVPIMTAVTTVTSTLDPGLFVKEKPVKPSLFFADSSSTRKTDPATGGFTDLTGSDFLSHLDDGRVYREMVDEFALPKFFASIRGMEHNQLFTEFNVGAARQMSLSAEAREGEIENLKAQLLLKEVEAAKAIRLRAEASKFEAIEKSLQDEVKSLKERNTTLEQEKNGLDIKVTDLAALVAVREREVADLDTQFTSVKSQNDNLVDRVHELEVSSFGLQKKVAVYEDCMGHLEKFQDDRMKEVNDKFDKLYTDFIEMALHLEERFYPHLLTTISSLRWLLT